MGSTSKPVLVIKVNGKFMREQIAEIARSAQHITDYHVLILPDTFDVSVLNGQEATEMTEEQIEALKRKFEDVIQS